MKQLVFAVGIGLTAVLTPVTVEAASLSGLYVFGDSLSDAGNTFDITFTPAIGTGFPPLPYAQRFTNGLTWVEYLGQELGLAPTLFSDVEAGAGLADGINFAVGGATTGSENTLALTASVTRLFPKVAELPGLQQQIAAFTNQIPTGGQADPDALYIVWAGATDYLPTEGAFVPVQTPQPPLANLASALQTLNSVGAKKILLVNLPPLGDTPLVRRVDQSVPGAAAALNQLADAHNAGLAGLGRSLSPDVNLLTLDINALFEEVASDPAQFGLTNVTEPCLTATGICADPSTYLFWDQLHPTTVAHKLISDRALAELQSQPPADVPEPAVSLGLLAIGMLGAGRVWQQRRQIR
jgi:phospholipase/lecithinase/hemolysin